MVPLMRNTSEFDGSTCSAFFRYDSPLRRSLSFRAYMIARLAQALPCIESSLTARHAAAVDCCTPSSKGTPPVTTWLPQMVLTPDQARALFTSTANALSNHAAAMAYRARKRGPRWRSATKYWCHPLSISAYDSLLTALSGRSGNVGIGIR